MELIEDQYALEPAGACLWHDKKSDKYFYNYEDEQLSEPFNSLEEAEVALNKYAEWLKGD